MHKHAKTTTKPKNKKRQKLLFRFVARGGALALKSVCVATNERTTATKTTTIATIEG